MRRPRSGGAGRRGQIPKMISIYIRPPEIENRLMPGKRPDQPLANNFEEAVVRTRQITPLDSTLLKIKDTNSNKKPTTHRMNKREN